MLPPVQFIANYIDITEQEMADMLRIIHTASFSKGELISKQGDLPNKLGFVLKGCVRAYYTDANGEEHTSGFVFENRPLTSISFFSVPAPNAMNTVALEPTELIVVSREDFFAFMDKYPRYEAALRKIFSEYIVLQDEQSRLMRIPNARQRYQTLLQAQPQLIQRVPLKYIASYLGMALETLSRVRASGK